MVAAVRRGQSMRSTAKAFEVPLSTVQHWCQRASGNRLDRVNWSDLSSAPRKRQRTSKAIEHRILKVRKYLQHKSILGEFGAAAIQRELHKRGLEKTPCVRTIGRVLARHGVLDARRRIRRPPPPKGWYLPDVAARTAELDSFDTIEGLAIQGGPHLTILTGISLHGGLIAAWPERIISAKFTLNALLRHWHEFGRPTYAQFDNDNRFTGPRQHPNAIGRVIRLCLSLGVIPVFAVPNETGFQATIESFNGRWQSKVWSRFHHDNLKGLKDRSRNYVVAARQRHAARMEAAPLRSAIPPKWKLDLQTPPQGKIVFLRRTNDKGRVSILGNSFLVQSSWVHRLVRAEVHLSENHINFYALRRREPQDQPLINQVPYTMPNRVFEE